LVAQIALYNDMGRDSNMSSLLDASVSELVQQIQHRSLSPIALVDAQISRIQSVNPSINAMVVNWFDDARRDAETADKLLQSTSSRKTLPPLLGIPFTVPETLGIKGMPQTGGSVYRWNATAPKDATVVHRLRRAGAIVLGVTNVPESEFWPETHNLIYGRTSNPWNIHHTSGGGCGGEAALVSMGGSPFGLGTDFNGSIRIPAAFCGVVAHKPTGRLVPCSGRWPAFPQTLAPMTGCGPITRRVADLSLILRIIAGPDNIDNSVQLQHIRNPCGVNIEQLQVFSLDTLGRTSMSTVMKNVLHQSAEHLASCGAAVTALPSDHIKGAFAIWSSMFTTQAGERLVDVLGNGTEIPVVREALRFAVGRANHTSSALLMALAETIQHTRLGKNKSRLAQGLALQTTLEEQLGENGVLLIPPYSRPAPRHRGTLATPFDFILTALFNAMEFPATIVPVGFDTNGMPIGIQVIAKRGNDHLTIAVAQQLEKEFGGWVRSQPVEV